MLRDYPPYRHEVPKFQIESTQGQIPVDGSPSLREYLYRPGQPTWSQEQIDALWDKVAQTGLVRPRVRVSRRPVGDLVKLLAFCFGGMLAFCLTFKVWHRR